MDSKSDVIDFIQKCHYMFRLSRNRYVKGGKIGWLCAWLVDVRVLIEGVGWAKVFDGEREQTRAFVVSIKASILQREHFEQRQ